MVAGSICGSEVRRDAGGGVGPRRAVWGLGGARLREGAPARRRLAGSGEAEQLSHGGAAEDAVVGVVRWRRGSHLNNCENWRFCLFTAAVQ